MEAKSPKIEPPKRKRRWFQFSLRTLLIAVTLLAVHWATSVGRSKIVRARNPCMVVSLNCQITHPIDTMTWERNNLQTLHDLGSRQEFSATNDEGLIVARPTRPLTDEESKDAFVKCS